MKKIFILILLNLSFWGNAQYYFPPTTGNTWETINPSELNFCNDKITELYTYLNNQNTKAFIMLKNGKIVLEQYFNGHTASDSWYWASAGKTLTATMVGIAQQENFLNINNKTSDYLGVGWTSCTLTQENAITVKNQLTMTSGLNDGVTDSSCYTPACLQFLAPAGTRWAYHNAPYTILDQVIANATGVTLNQYTTTKLKNPTGMTGSFFSVDNNNVFFSTARSMARFGLLMLNNGNWNGNQILNTNYFNQMVNTSQNLNKSYGYLWWLNGKESYMVPQSQIVFTGNLMNNAPADTYMALGKNGQFINVVPSSGIVWIRMGDQPNGVPVDFLLNNEIWSRINALNCNLSTTVNLKNRVWVSPNPVNDILRIETESEILSKYIYTIEGQLFKTEINNKKQIDLSNFSTGFYFVNIETTLGSEMFKVLKK
jgi:CubicO group peptidase (beta-lactamase class C family)